MSLPIIDSESRVRVAPSIYVRPFGEELVLLDFSRGEYFGLDPTGAVVWHALAEGKRLADAAERLCEQFDVDRESAERDVAALVTELVAASLVTLVTLENDI